MLSYNSSASESEMWYDERTYKVATYRKLPYGFDRKQLTNLSNYMNNVCELPFGGILNSSFNGGDSFTARVSFNINKSFNEVHSLSLLGGLDLQSQKSTGISEDEFGDICQSVEKISCLWINWMNGPMLQEECCR